MLRKDRGRIQGCRATSAGGFTLVELMIVVAILGLLLAIAAPNWARARAEAQRKACISNLRMMEAAKVMAALENKWAPNTGPGNMGNPAYRDTVSEFIRGGQRPVCPTGSPCFYNAINQKATCESGIPDHRL